MLVANARRLRLIYADGRKTDEIDAQKLARLARLGPELPAPLEHRGEDSQVHLALIHSREALVGTRTAKMDATAWRRCWASAWVSATISKICGGPLQGSLNLAPKIGSPSNLPSR